MCRRHPSFKFRVYYYSLLQITQLNLLRKNHSDPQIATANLQGVSKVYALFLEDCITFFHILEAIFLE